MNDVSLIPILELLPQRPPFVMVDKLVVFDDQVAETEFVIRGDNIFCADGKFLEAGLVENVAQTCAARIGYVNKILNNQSVKIGIIGAIRNFEIFTLPAPGDVLRTRTTIESEVFAMTLVTGKVWCGEKLLAKCEMKISVTDTEIG